MPMKYSFFIIMLLLFSCKNETAQSENEVPEIASLQKGETLFQENNCVACHQVNQKIVGPSLQDMAKIYKQKNGDFVAFLKQEAQPIVDPSQYETMKINLQVTKNMTDAELQSLELYLSSHSK